MGINFQRESDQYMFHRSPIWHVGIQVKEIERELLQHSNLTGDTKENIVRLYKIMKDDDKQFKVYSLRKIWQNGLVGIYTGKSFYENNTANNEDYMKY
jgi:hypothetical protein